MSLSSTFGSRPPAYPTQLANVQAGSKAVAAQVAPASGNVAAALPTVEPVGLQEDIVSLSRQGLQARGVSGSTSSGSENAQSLMAIFAKRLFGDDTGTGGVAYRLTSYEASSSSASASVQQTGPNGTEAAAAYDFRQNFSFTGVGELSTEDGRSFEFEIKVNFEASEQSLSKTEAPVLETPDVLVLTGKPLPAIKFPGSLDDLFRVLSRELRTDVSNGVESGELTLRLQRLVDRAALLAPRARADDPEISPAERNKALAATYSSAPTLRDLSQA